MNERIIHLDIGAGEMKFQNGDVLGGRELACGGLSLAGMGDGLTGNLDAVTCSKCQRVIQAEMEMDLHREWDGH